MDLTFDERLVEEGEEVAEEERLTRFAGWGSWANGRVARSEAVRGRVSMRRTRIVDGLTPLGSMAAGAVAGAVGTAGMDALLYWRSGGSDGPLEWEFGGVDTWESASAPGQVGRRLLEGFLDREVPDRWAQSVQNVVHWGTGVAWGVQFGVVAGSAKCPAWLAGLLLGPAAWLSAYTVLPLAGLYKPIWEYKADTLAKDLGAHVVYGAATGAVFVVLSHLRPPARRLERSCSGRGQCR